MASSVSQNAAPEPLAETIPAVTVTPASTENETDDEHAHSRDEPQESPRPQAGPLPRKRGELGFQEGVHDVSETQAQASASVTSLPARHPADRDQSTLPQEGAASTSEPPRSPSRAESTDTANSTGKRSLISFLKSKHIPTLWGLRLTTLGLFIFQVALLALTIAGWVLIIQKMQKTSSSSSDQSSGSDPNSPNDGNGDNDSTSVFNTSSAQIFVHVAFAILSLAELIFLERSVFRLRAERYMYVHPGEILPRTRRRASQEVAMGFAPWNRPPLPTYAAALAQSGVGTGDVEDNIIAIPPPPAYGNTRGSTLLLSSFLTDALRSQRPGSRGSAGSRASARSQRSQTSGQEEGDRPKSYMSTDSEWEARLDADRTLVLEETLARLEDGSERRRVS